VGARARAGVPSVFPPRGGLSRRLARNRGLRCGAFGTLRFSLVLDPGRKSARPTSARPAAPARPRRSGESARHKPSAKSMTRICEVQADLVVDPRARGRQGAEVADRVVRGGEGVRLGQAAEEEGGAILQRCEKAAGGGDARRHASDSCTRKSQRLAPGPEVSRGISAVTGSSNDEPASCTWRLVERACRSRAYLVAAELLLGRPHQSAVHLVVVGRALDREINVLDPRQLER
jgi:hypothetical protein